MTQPLWRIELTVSEGVLKQEGFAVTALIRALQGALGHGREGLCAGIWTQVLEDMTSTCRYSGPHGCTLPRSSRPWICSWYLCPAQKARLGQGPKTVRTSLTLTLQEVKKGRKELEDRFIDLVCSSPGNDPRS